MKSGYSEIELDIQKNIVQVPQTHRLTYFNHVTRIGSDHCPHLLLHGYTHGHHSKGRPKKKWLENFHDYCKEISITTYEASFTTRCKQDKMEEHCTPHGLPARSDNVIVARQDRSSDRD